MPPKTLEELHALLAAHDLPTDLADRAAWGLALLPGGEGRSRLGGVPELPGPWPLNDGRALTHLASIAFDELPRFPGREQLPADGTLVFFGDFSLESEGWGPADGDYPPVELAYVAPGQATVPPDPPEELRAEHAVPVVLTERRVRFEPVITMPYLFDLPADLRPAYRTFGPAMGSAQHLVLGEPLHLQGDPREPGEISLLHLNWDPDLGFTHGDGGQISFYGAAEDIAAGRWDRVKATSDGS